MYYHVFGTYRFFTTGVVTQYWRTIQPIAFDDAPKLVADWGNKFSNPQAYYSQQEGRLRYWYIVSKYGQMSDIAPITPQQNGANDTSLIPGMGSFYGGFERISQYNNPPNTFPFWGGYEVTIDRVIEITNPLHIPVGYLPPNFAKLSVFPLTPSIGFNTEVQFNTTVLENAVGNEQRIINWHDPIRIFNLSRGLLTEPQLNTLLDFHEDMKGSTKDFLYKDLSDFKATATPKQLAADTYTQGILYPKPDGVNRNFQLLKIYVCSNNVHYKYTPNCIPSTLEIFRSGASTSIDGDTYNILPDRILFDIAPQASQDYLTANFEYYTPVHFESNQLDYVPINRVDSNGVKHMKFKVPQLILKESRVESYQQLPIDIIEQELSHQFDFDLFSNCTISPKFETNTVTLSSGWDKRILRRKNAIELNRLQEKNIITADRMEYLLTLWLTTKGSAVSFKFLDLVDDVPYNARFNNPSLSYDNKSANLIFGLRELQIRKLPDIILPDIGTGESLTQSVLTLCTCIEITLTTGEKLGYTTFSRDITIDGTIFKARRAFDPNAQENKLDTSVDNQELRSVFDQDFTEQDLLSDRFRNAQIITAVVDVNDIPDTLLDLPESQIHIGLVGEVTAMGEETFTVENLSKPSTLLRQSRLWKTEPICWKDFGSVECGIDLDNAIVNSQPLKVTTCVTTVSDRKTFRVNTICPNAAWGKIIFKDGLNAGSTYPIYECLPDPFSGTTLLTLFVGCADTVSPNDEVEIIAGCSKQQSACKAYNNFVNYGGLPTGNNWMPGNDFYIRSPKSP